MKVFYTDHFVLPLPEKHRFPMDKYRGLRERVMADDSDRFELLVPPAASNAELALAHAREYIESVIAGTLEPKAVRELGFPWSPELVERSRRSVGATIAGSEIALCEGIAVSLAGGTHHAYADRPQGFCVFNDAVVAARCMQRRGLAKRMLVIDCDVHQGNGTAHMTAGDDSIFTFSIHGEKNFPVRKECSDLDVAVEDRAGDRRYLELLDDALGTLDRLVHPELVFYLAGADPFEEDRWGRVALSRAGLRARDERVFSWCEARGVPVMVTMAGGYAPDIDAIVDIHFATVERAAGSSLSGGGR